MSGLSSSLCLVIVVMMLMRRSYIRNRLVKEVNKMSEVINPRVQINCTQCYRPNIVVNTYSDSDSDSEYDPRDSESDTDYDSDESFVSDTETEASVSEDEDSESESDEVKPYYGHGFRVYFDSLKDRRHFMRAFGFN
jgi:hypothetical protein